MDVVSRFRSTLMHVEPCHHLTVWRNMCAECGLDLREYALFISDIC